MGLKKKSAFFNVVACGTLSIAVANCGGSSGGQSDQPEPRPARESLISQWDWQFEDASEDSLVSHRPATVDCDEDIGWYVENFELEVQTNDCNYLSLAQQSHVEVRHGDFINLVYYHTELIASEPAQAHVRLTIDGKLLWEKYIDIPGDTGIYNEDIPIDFDAPAGSLVEYHLHNHGSNTWSLSALDVLAAESNNAEAPD